MPNHRPESTSKTNVEEEMSEGAIVGERNVATARGQSTVLCTFAVNSRAAVTAPHTSQQNRHDASHLMLSSCCFPFSLAFEGGASAQHPSASRDERECCHCRSHRLQMLGLAQVSRPLRNLPRKIKKCFKIEVRKKNAHPCLHLAKTLRYLPGAARRCQSGRSPGSRHQT